MKTIKTLALFFAAALALTACSSSNDDDGGSTTPTPSETTTKVLHLSIKGSGSVDSRAFGTFDGSDGITDGSTTVDESRLNTLLVAIYNNDTHRIERKNYVNVDQDEIDPSTHTYVTSITYVATHPTVIVLANVPDTTLKVGQDEATIKARTAQLALTSIGTAASGDPVQVNTVNNTEITNLPMVGSTSTVNGPTSTINNPTDYNEYNATVVLNRLVARVSLASISASSDMLSTDTVRITDVFIRHAYVLSPIVNAGITPDNTYMSLYGTPVMDIKNLMTGKNFDTSTPQVDTEKDASYLHNTYTERDHNATSQIDWDNSNKMAYFYIFPYDDGKSGTFSQQTQLVIKGHYTRWATSRTDDNGNQLGPGRTIDKETFYPIVINGTPSTKVIYNGNQPSTAGNDYLEANRQYNIAATIQGLGQDKDVYNGGGNPNDTEQVTITVSVKDWLPVITQTVTVGKK